MNGKIHQTLLCVYCPGPSTYFTVDKDGPSGRRLFIWERNIIVPILVLTSLYLKLDFIRNQGRFYMN